MGTERNFEAAELIHAVEEYKKQQSQLMDQLRMLDDQRVQSVKTLDMLTGAIAALETLLNSPEAGSSVNEQTEEDE